MRLFNLSDNQNQPCYILRCHGVTIMLDCGLDQTSLLNFLPVHNILSDRGRPLELNSGCLLQCLRSSAFYDGKRVFIDSQPEVNPPEVSLTDIAQVDVILLSSAQTALALPYMVSVPEFRAKVFATEPTLHYAKMLMEELSEESVLFSNEGNDLSWKNPTTFEKLNSEIKKLLGVCMAEGFLAPVGWRHIYSKRQIENALSHVHSVAYDENVDILGVLSVIPVSSGFCLGSTNWILQLASKKIVYMSSSSTIPSHPTPLNAARLGGADLMICSSLATSDINKSSPTAAFASKIFQALKNGSRIVIPISVSSLLFDLLEIVQDIIDNFSATPPPGLFVVSDVGQSALAYANIFSEWVEQSSQELTYLPLAPFTYGQEGANEKVRCFSNIHEEFVDICHGACVVFCSHPSLRFGHAAALAKRWGRDNTLLLLVDPEFCGPEVYAPFMPMECQVICMPLDFRLRLEDFDALLTDTIRPKRLVLPSYFSDKTLTFKTVMHLRRGEVSKLDLKDEFRMITLSQDVADSVNLRSCPKGFVGFCSGELDMMNGKLQLQVPTRDSSSLRSESFASYMFGTVNVPQLVDRLKQKDFRVVEKDGGVELPNVIKVLQLEMKHLKAEIRIYPHLMEVDCPREELRLSVKAALEDSFTII